MDGSAVAQLGEVELRKALPASQSENENKQFGEWVRSKSRTVATRQRYFAPCQDAEAQVRGSFPTRTRAPLEDAAPSRVGGTRNG